LAANFLDRGAWEVLWGELHHQGDVGEASYAAVPHLVGLAAAAPKRDWNVYALVATIEIERHRQNNPPLPSYLTESYTTGFQQLAELALSELKTAKDRYVVRSALSVVALARGEAKLGALLGHLDDSEIDDFAETQLAWSDLYRNDDQSPSSV
jgi:hypothetical protein